MGKITLFVRYNELVVGEWGGCKQLGGVGRLFYFRRLDKWQEINKLKYLVRN